MDYPTKYITRNIATIVINPPVNVYLTYIACPMMWLWCRVKMSNFGTRARILSKKYMLIAKMMIRPMLTIRMILM
jgi:hypothetical protein